MDYTQTEAPQDTKNDIPAIVACRRAFANAREKDARAAAAFKRTAEIIYRIRRLLEERRRLH